MRRGGNSSSATVPLVGTACMILGALIVTFDYPQIKYLDGIDAAMDPEQGALYSRLITEFVIGLAILAAGAAMCAPHMAARLWQKRRP